MSLKLSKTLNPDTTGAPVKLSSLSAEQTLYDSHSNMVSVSEAHSKSANRTAAERCARRVVRSELRNDLVAAGLAWLEDASNEAEYDARLAALSEESARLAQSTDQPQPEDEPKEISVAELEAIVASRFHGLGEILTELQGSTLTRVRTSGLREFDDESTWGDDLLRNGGFIVTVPAQGRVPRGWSS